MSGPAGFDDSSPATSELSIALSPEGHLHVRPAALVSAGGAHEAVTGKVVSRFERGDGHGLFWLGAALPDDRLPPVLAFWRDVGRTFVVKLCAVSDLEALRARVDIEIPADELAALAGEAPPMMGGEYLSV